MPQTRLASYATMVFLSVFLDSHGASPYNPDGRTHIAQFALPWDGPGAAFFNPAHLAETGVFDVRTSFFSTGSGKAGVDIYQGSVRIYEGLCAGISYLSNFNAIDGSNAVYEEFILSPMVAYGLDSIGGSGYSLAFGVAAPLRGFNAFGAVKSISNSLDMGMHMHFPSMGAAGRIHSGLGMRNLVGGYVKLPEDNPALVSNEYEALRLNIDASIFWSDVIGFFDFYAEISARKIHDPSEGPEMSYPLFKSLGVEFHPHPILGMKIERTWLQTWTAGAVLRVPIKDILVLGMEANISHDKIFTEKDEGRGFLRSIALNVAM